MILKSYLKWCNNPESDNAAYQKILYLLDQAEYQVFINFFLSGFRLISPVFDEISKLSKTDFILEEGLSQTVQNVVQLTLNYNFLSLLTLIVYFKPKILVLRFLETFLLIRTKLF